MAGCPPGFLIGPKLLVNHEVVKKKEFVQFFLRPFSFPENVLPPATLLFAHASNWFFQIQV